MSYSRKKSYNTTWDQRQKESQQAQKAVVEKALSKKTDSASGKPDSQDGNDPETKQQ